MRVRQDAPQNQPATRPGTQPYAVEFGTGRLVPSNRQGTVHTTVRGVMQSNAMTRRPGS